MDLKYYLNLLLQGDGSCILSPEFMSLLNSYVIQEINKNVNDYDENDLDIIGDILHIGNIIYNNTDLNDDQQPLDNGTYDILLERYRVYRVPQVGAEPIYFDSIKKTTPLSIDAKPLVVFLDDRDLLYENELLSHKPITKNDLVMDLVTFNGYQSDKKYRVVSHNNPTLVGTLDKCKYVLNSQAIEKGVFDDPSVKILERDFFEPHFRMGLINNSTIMRMILELKYDGLSVVVTIRNSKVIAAVSRGDTGNDAATDLTPVLYGYSFPNLPNLDIDIDVKCEAVMTYYDLNKYNEEKQKNYANCRSSIIGLFSSNDGYLYQKYVTLVPLAVAATNLEDSLPLDNRLEELEFINEFLITKEMLRYTYIEGTYDKVMFLIKKFVDEAEYVRPLMPTMYDGVVLSYADNSIRSVLGRENFINKYSVAIKFNTMKKLTTLVAIDYTVGQNGQITPMAHYQPIEFLGTIHTKSSIASVARFNENRFKLGNTIEVEYRNDVMPYVTTSLLDSNDENPNPILEFTKVCPACGSELVFSASGKSAMCPNIMCKGRAIARMANMMDKLELKDFAEASMEKLNSTSLTELMNYTREELVPIIGDINAAKFILRMNDLKEKPIYDFQIVGALGFSNIAQETWKKIFNHYTLKEIDSMYNDGSLSLYISNIKGIGPATINTITDEYLFFQPDINFILNMSNIVSSKGLKQKSIRVTGFRDPELMTKLCAMGFDASDKGVTRETDILLIPSKDHKSSKLSKIGTNTLVLTKEEFINNMDKYLS